uniref:Leukocyte cell-derived chemotaxin 1 n=1 Tax=Salmo trutta TaxID=8032 RepID=A0A673YFX2_SALTR
YSSSAAKPPVAVGCLLRFGVAALVAGAVSMLCGSIGAFYLWKVSDKNVYNVHYSMSVNGKVEEGSMEIVSNNNLEKFQTGRIQFSGGKKHYIKSQIKTFQRCISPSQEDEIMPVKFDKKSLIWVAADRPLKTSSFLSTKVLDLCGDLPIFWLQHTYPKEIQERRRKLQDRWKTEKKLCTVYQLDQDYTHCQRICEPLGYNYRGCQVSYRDILPCCWWVACILGVV